MRAASFNSCCYGFFWSGVDGVVVEGEDIRVGVTPDTRKGLVVVASMSRPSRRPVPFASITRFAVVGGVFSVDMIKVPLWYWRLLELDC